MKTAIICYNMLGCEMQETTVAQWPTEFPVKTRSKCKTLFWIRTQNVTIQKRVLLKIQLVTYATYKTLYNYN